jgi:hypothetical protein
VLRIAPVVVLVFAAFGCGENGVDVLTPISTLVQVDAAGVDLMPSACSTADVALCDGFEADAISPPWLKVEHLGAIDVEGGRAYRGLHSARMHTNGVPAGGDVMQTEVIEQPVLPNPFYLRVFVYAPSPSPDAIYRLAGALQQAYPYEGAAIEIDHGALTYVSPAPALTVTKSATLLPTDRWVCVEWRLTLDAAAGETQTWIDGQEVGDLHLQGNTLPAGSDTNPVHQLSLGTAFFVEPRPTTPYDLWIDEVIVDSRRVGCGG